MTDGVVVWDLSVHPEKGVCSPDCVPCRRWTKDGCEVVCAHGRSPVERAEQRRMFSVAARWGVRLHTGPGWFYADDGALHYF